jgi:hypothetical protein
MEWQRLFSPISPSPPRSLAPSLPRSLSPFLVAWTLPSALFYTLVHFGSPGYAMTYLGAALLGVAWALEPVWRRVGRRGQAAILIGVAAVNAWVFLGGAPVQGGQAGFGVMTLGELRGHETYWERVGCFIRARYRPGEVAVLVPPSFTDGLRTAEYLLPEYWPATGLAVDPVKLRRTPASLKPGYFRYVTPEDARRDGRPTLCIARVPLQTHHFRTLFGESYTEVSIGGGMQLGEIPPASIPALSSTGERLRRRGGYEEPRGRSLP